MTEIPGWWWIGFTLLAAGAQVLRNVMQKSLTQTLGTIGATHVRFLFGLPFGLLFLLLVLLVSGRALPAIPITFWAWVVLGGVAQIAATALMLSAMQSRSFVVATAYAKTEPVQLALFALIFLGDALSFATLLAILIATVGVLLMSWPKAGALNTAAAQNDNRRSALFGVISGSMFALSVVGFRGAILSLESGSFVVNATLTLAVGQLIQTTLLTSYLALRSPATLGEIFKAWRPSILAGFMGAFGSQMWFLAFALETAARVRTLALVEILFAQALSRKLFAQDSSRRELVGIALVVGGVAILLNA
jgi:uncharacterized membrane protein